MIIQFNIIAQIVCYDDRLNETSSAVLAVVCISGFVKVKLKMFLNFRPWSLLSEEEYILMSKL